MTTPTALPSLSVDEVPIEDLRPDPANPRRISEDELDALERSMRQFGFVQPVLARLGLRHAALFWEMRAIAAEAELARRSRSRAGRAASDLAERWQAWCSATVALLTGIYAAEEARMLLERRYLNRHAAAFPDAIADWERLRVSLERLAGLGGALPPVPVGRRRAPRSTQVEPPGLDLGALRAGARAQAPALAARLVEQAQAATLGVLGDAARATSISARRLRATASDDTSPG